MEMEFVHKPEKDPDTTPNATPDVTPDASPRGTGETVDADHATRSSVDNATIIEDHNSRGEDDATIIENDATKGEDDSIMGEDDAITGEDDAIRGEVDAIRGKVDFTTDEEDVCDGVSRVVDDTVEDNVNRVANINGIKYPVNRVRVVINDDANSSGDGVKSKDSPRADGDDFFRLLTPKDVDQESVCCRSGKALQNPRMSVISALSAISALIRTKAPSNRMEQGDHLMYNKTELLPKTWIGKPLVDIDEFYIENKWWTFVVINKNFEIFRFSSSPAFCLFSPFNILRRWISGSSRDDL
jgi:hypothetical protein